MDLLQQILRDGMQATLRELSGIHIRVVEDVLIDTVIFQPNDGMSSDRELRSRISTQAFGYLATGLGVKTTQALSELVQSTPVLQDRLLSDFKVENGTGQMRLEFQQTVFQPFAKAYLDKSKTLQWDDTAFAYAYQCLFDYLEATAIQMTAYWSLEKFEIADDSSIEIDDATTIRAMSEGERKLRFETISESLGSSMWDAFDAARPKYLIEVRYDVDPTGSWPLDVLRQTHVQFVIDALRVSYSGSVELAEGWSQSASPFQRGSSGQITKMQTVSTDMPKTMVDVGAATTANLRRRMEQLASLSSDSEFAVALRRFHLAFQRGMPEDRLIDAWIGLEALFTTSDEKLEIADKVSRRIARLLGSELDERNEIKRRAKALYGARSKTVHGVVPKQSAIASDVTDSVEYLRRAIELRLDINWTITQVEDAMMI